MTVHYGGEVPSPRFFEFYMNLRKHPHRRAPERGVTIVEAAVILLLFFMVLFGVMEAGMFLKTRQALTNAAREGARLAVAPYSGTDTLPTTAEITTRVDQFLSSAGVTGATVTVTRPVLVTTGLVQTAYTQVTVSKPYQVISVPGFFSMLQITLRGQALMRNETSE
jgi:Flp pilus assembly protein TadG